MDLTMANNEIDYKKVLELLRQIKDLMDNRYSFRIRTLVDMALLEAAKNSDIIQEYPSSRSE